MTAIDAEALARLRDHTIDFDGSPMPLHAETFPITCGELIALLDIAEAVARAPVAEIDSSGELVVLVAEGGGLDNLVTCMRIDGMHGQRVRIVPCTGGGE